MWPDDNGSTAGSREGWANPLERPGAERPAAAAGPRRVDLDGLHKQGLSSLNVDEYQRKKGCKNYIIGEFSEFLGTTYSISFSFNKNLLILF